MHATTARALRCEVSRSVRQVSEALALTLRSLYGTANPAERAALLGRLAEQLAVAASAATVAGEAAKAAGLRGEAAMAALLADVECAAAARAAARGGDRR